jgi:uncharacterized protein
MLRTKSFDGPHSRWSGWFLDFRKERAAPYSASAGIRVLVACIFLEGLARPAVREALRSFGFGRGDLGRLALVTCLAILAISLTAVWIRLPFSRIGLYGWGEWRKSEKWFFPQIVVLSLFVFTLVEWKQLAALAERPDWIRVTLVIFLGQVIWGFYQEYVYRGLLQTELVRQWGTVPGILVSNLLFTFGPLHAYHFSNLFEDPGRLLIFASIFGIGLYFGVLFHRSGNLWIIAATHGLGDFFIDGLAMLK